MSLMVFHSLSLVGGSAARGLQCHRGRTLRIAVSSPERQHINPIEFVTYDWVHSMLQHGVFNLEVEGFLQVGSPFGVSRKQMQEFLQDPAWRYPHFQSSKKRQLYRIFDARRVGSDDKGHVKCT